MVSFVATAISLFVAAEVEHRSRLTMLEWVILVKTTTINDLNKKIMMKKGEPDHLDNKKKTSKWLKQRLTSQFINIVTLFT